ncbi:unnamed protein product [Mytilus edulis]|uniref:Uncharacterized protein n=1 Tax=Mytilus edulis TaxID=6550 RepID=A0A8S3SCJ9_MYTED|nr:unnamed protein product [Mytilus edulis]
MGIGQLTPNVSIKESHQRGQLPQMLSTPHMHNHNSKTYPWNLPPPGYKEMQPKSATQSDLETRHEQKTQTMEFNKSSMKNLVTGFPLQLSSILSNNPPIDQKDSETSQGLKSMLEQPVISTPPVTAAADIKPLLVTGNDNQEEHFLGVTKPQKDLG